MENKWIPVSEGLPEPPDGRFVLVSVDAGIGHDFVGIAYCRGDQWHVFDNEQVKAWQELPEVYKEDK